MRALHRALLIVASLSISTAASAAGASTPTNDDRPIAFVLKAERATIAYRVQGDRPIEHAVADALVLGGQRFPARTTDKGQLEIELTGDGKFALARPGPLTLTLGKAEDKRRAKIDVFLSRAPDGSWAYRTITRLSGQIGDEHVAVIDVDGDGAFNQPGVDAIVLGASEYGFPLPAGDERWCAGSLDVTGLSFGPLGEQPKISGRMLATTVPETLALLKGINDERLKLGLTPRPENPTLSAPLQKHCGYMVGTGTLAHPEEAGTPNYSPEGHEAGMNSILSIGTAAANVAAGMVATFYHRQDVVRPDTRGFGVGYQGKFGGIDGRRDLTGQAAWPILVPAPDEAEVPMRFGHESPDPIGGDRDAGYPVTAYFGRGGLTLTTGSLELLDKNGAKAVDCYLFDSKTGGEVSFNQFQHVVGLISKEPLAEGATYRVTMTVDAGGTPWKKTWQFTTIGAPKKK